MKSLLRSIFQRLIQDLGLRRGALRRRYNLEEDLLQSLQDLAERERRSQDDLTTELLSYALTQRAIEDENLRRWQELTQREQQIAALTCLNFTNRQIAAHLIISPETVKTHVRNVLFKFDLHSKAELRKLLKDWDFSDWLDA
jgi:DNA-binding CsgD family transcriptional regulator